MDLRVIKRREPHIGPGHDRHRTGMVALEGAAGLKHPAAGSPAGRAAQIAEALVRRIYDDKPWNDRTDRNLAVVLRRVRLRLGLCHPPSGAVALAVIGVKVNTPERLQ